MANLHRALRRAIRRRETETTSSELNIVPFLDVVTNLMLFLLATSASVAATSEVRAELPGYAPRHEPGTRPPALGLSVTLTDAGAVMATSEGRLGPDCEPAASGAATAGRTPSGYDVATVTRCASALHDLHPADREVVVSADPDVPYGDVVAVMDALRAQGEEELFPDVRVSAGVR